LRSNLSLDVLINEVLIKKNVYPFSNQNLMHYDLGKQESLLFKRNSLLGKIDHMGQVEYIWLYYRMLFYRLLENLRLEDEKFSEVNKRIW